jgi:hypothetical protein
MYDLGVLLFSYYDMKIKKKICLKWRGGSELLVLIFQIMQNVK